MADRLDQSEIVVRLGVRCTTPRRALFDEMRRSAGTDEAVVAMDMAAAARITSIQRMRTYVSGRAGWLGVDLVRSALDRADEGSASPPETRIRLLWLESGLPPPCVNRPVFSLDGRLLGYPDLLDAEAGLVVEYDGDDHRAARRHSADVDREALFRRHLLEVTRMTGDDVRRPAKAVARLLEARERALWLPPEERPWTLRTPPGFELELPLDAELDLLGEPP